MGAVTREQDQTMSTWTVGEVARELGVTVRTLHHYDEIGLVVPTERSAAGYRLYTEPDLERLQHVVVYRRLELSLEQIRNLLQGGDAQTHLRRQREAVLARLDELAGLVTAIDNALEKTMSDQRLTHEELKELFGGEFYDHRDEAEQRWGDTDAWRESQERQKGYGRAEWTQIKAETDQLQGELARLFKAGVPATDPAATAAVEAHRQHITRWFYDCPPEMHRNLGELYVSDPRFTASYDEEYAAPGLAQWVRDAIGTNADRQDAAG